MAVMAGVFNETQRRTLEAFCDTIVPAVEYDGSDEAMRAFMSRSAADMAIAAQIEGLMAQALMPEDIAGFAALLDALAGNDFASLPLEVRTAVLGQVSASGPEAQARREDAEEPHAAVLLRAARRAGPQPELGGDRLPRPDLRAAVRERGAEDDRRRGASAAPRPRSRPTSAWWAPAPGGGVIAAELQKAGKSVLVLEQGAYRNEQDFKQLELPGSLELYLGGGLLGIRGRVDLRARGRDARRRHRRQLHELHPHARAHPARSGRSMASSGIDDPGYEAHIDAVWERLSVNSEATSQNRSHRKLIEGLDELGFPQADHAQRRPRVRRPAGLRLLLHGLPARLQAVDDEDLPAGRRGRRRALRRRRPRRADPGRRRSRDRRHRPPSRTRTGRPPRSRSRPRRSSSPPARSSRPRCCSAAASAARPPASTCVCIPRASSAGSTRSRSRAGSARSSRPSPYQFAEHARVTGAS